MQRDESGPDSDNHLVLTTETCDCSGPGLCQRWQRQVGQHGYRICRSGDEEKIARFFISRLPQNSQFVENLILGRNGKAIESIKPRDRWRTCAHLGISVRGDDGKQQERQCATCQGNVRLKIYQCNHPSIDLTDSMRCAKCEAWEPKQSRWAREKKMTPMNPSANVIWRTAHFSGWQSFGQLAFQIGEELEKRGVPVVFVPMNSDDRQLALPPFVKSRISPKADRTANWVVQSSSPQTAAPAHKNVIKLTCWDSDSLNAKQLFAMNACRGVIGLSEFNRKNWMNAGVSSPIGIVPLGVDLSVFSHVSPPPLDQFVFGTSGRLVHGRKRKNVEFVAETFLGVADQMPGSILKIKITPGDAIDWIPKDPRIHVDVAVWPNEKLADWYRSLSVYISANRGESWGLQTHQAMAVGRPTIVTRWGGTMDFWTEQCGWGLEHGYGPADDPGWEGTGDWAIPTRKSLESAMRHSYRKHHLVLCKGEMAAHRAALFTWDRSAKFFHQFLIQCGMLEPFHDWDKDDWNWRPGTYDRETFLTAMNGNEYELPDKFDPGSIVIDLGCHVGGFSINAAKRGASVFTVEADPIAADLAYQNFKQAGVEDRITISQAAAWSSTGKILNLHRVIPNAGGSYVCESHGDSDCLQVQTIGLDDLISGPIAFLKLDIEGSELPVLDASKKLRMVRKISGEWHAEYGATPNRITTILERNGFAVRTKANPHAEEFGWFWAEKNP